MATTIDDIRALRIADYDYDLLMRLSHLYSENSSGEAMQNIDYGYDDADNITDIFNSAVTLANGLGGNYWSHYDYDNLYRLGHAEGDWGGGQLNYHLDMQYHPNGRIEHKELYADVMDPTGTVTVSNYSNSYQYNAGQPNTLENVTDDFTGWEQNFSWDAAGNMTVHDHYAEGCSRQMCWDEENHLISFSDHCRNAGFYQYDANGERTYKLTGGYAAQNIQGHWWSYNLLDNPTLYASPYLVATAQGYTKHYYAENERIASRIGGGGLADIAQTVVNMEDLSGDVWAGEMQPIWDEVELPQYHINRLYESRNHLTDAMMCAGEDPLVEENRLEGLRTYWQYVQDEGEPLCYWYHPDHLGSSSWITEKSGHSVQHLHYLPWGEDFVDQRTSSWSAIHTFSAKEKDSETGLSYFGARYYSSDLSIWLSVDPMSDKYPSLSPYTYCANNPVKLVDPNGEEIGGPDDPPTKYIIKKGDTFWDLENARNLPHGTLQRQNPSLDPNNLQVGTEINYPYMQGDLIISDNSVPTGDIPEYYNQPTSSGPVMDMSNYNAVSPLIAMMGIQDPRFFKRSPVTNAKFTYKKVCSIRSFEDIVRNPKLLWGKSQQEMEQIIGKGWTGGKYGNNGEGWKFTKGDKSVFYHNGGRHQGPYYGFSSGKTGKVKVVGKGYVPSSDDKSTIIYYTK